MSNARRNWENAILGIDNGSTSSRMFLLSESGREIVIECPQLGDHTRQEPGDFSSRCYPFADNDDKDPYIGNAPDHARLAASIKPVFLVLAQAQPGDFRDLLLEYPHGGELLSRVESHGKPFLARLKAAIDGFCAYLRDRLVKTCKKERLIVTAAGIAIPAQWPAAVEDFVADIFLKKLLNRAACFSVSRGDILFHSETQALAHFLFKQDARELKVLGSNEGVYFLADFGGQNLNISMYHAQFGRNGAVAFYEMEESRGFVGGGELMDYYIGEHCEAVVRSEGRELPQKYKQHLIDEFHSLKKRVDLCDNIPEHMQTLHCKDIHIKLTPDVIRDAFEKAMSEPLGRVIEVLQTCDRSNGGRGPQVIVAGGTARSAALQGMLFYLCHEAEVDEPFFVDDLSRETAGRYPSLNVAKGAAYASANNMNVIDFINRGAAIGVQVKEAGHAVWNDRAPILCYKEGDVSPQTLNLNDGDELKLICDPFVKQSSRSETIFYRRAYDLYNLGVFKGGQVRLATYVGLPDSGDNERGARTLMLRVWRRRNLERPSRDDDWLIGSAKLPLNFHRSSGCMLVSHDQATRDIPQQMLMEFAGAQTESNTSDSQAGGQDGEQDGLMDDAEAHGDLFVGTDPDLESDGDQTMVMANDVDDMSLDFILGGGA